MLQMVYKKEVILNICHCIELCKQQQLFDNNIVDEDYTPLEAMFASSRIQLGSRQCSLKIPSYEKVLEEMLGFCNFGNTSVDVCGSDFNRDYLYQII